MTVVWVFIGGLAGLVLGAGLGFGLALALASRFWPRHDGSFGMREILVGVPAGAVLGGLAGIAWGLGALGA